MACLNSFSGFPYFEELFGTTPTSFNNAERSFRSAISFHSITYVAEALVPEVILQIFFNLRNATKNTLHSYPNNENHNLRQSQLLGEFCILKIEQLKNLSFPYFKVNIGSYEGRNELPVASLRFLYASLT